MAEGIQISTQVLLDTAERVRSINSTLDQKLADVFRHTWATNALRKQVPLSIISQALGHTSEKTTRFYLASLEQSELNRANARVTEEVDLLLAAG